MFGPRCCSCFVVFVLAVVLGKIVQQEFGDALVLLHRSKTRAGNKTNVRVHSVCCLCVLFLFVCVVVFLCMLCSVCCVCVVSVCLCCIFVVCLLCLL